MDAKPLDITVYRTGYCPFCIEAERFLRDQGVDFEEVFLDDRPDGREVVSGILPGHRTFPLIVIGGRPIGGYQELMGLARSGELARLLAG